MPRALILRPSAKINLTLRVGPLRADGFHDVVTLLQSIALADTLTVTSRRGPFTLATRSPGIPKDRTNLVWRAAELLWRDLGRAGDPRDAHAKLDKQIPAAAGLGGGSADAAATLVALNTVWAGKRSRRELAGLAAQLGADVPFFLQGGTALGTGRGDELYPLDDVQRLAVILLKPPFGVRAADAYRWLDEDRSRLEAAEPAHAQPRAVEVGWPGGPVGIANDLQPAVARRHPAIDEMIEACLGQGALAAAMTGSGAAVFGVFREAVAKKAVGRLKRADWHVLLTKTLTRREASRRLGL